MAFRTKMTPFGTWVIYMERAKPLVRFIAPKDQA